MIPHRVVFSRIAPAALASLALAAACSNSSSHQAAAAADTVKADSAGFTAIPTSSTPAPPSAAPAASNAAQAAPAADVADACRVVPVDSVARVLQQTIGKSVRSALAYGSGNCTYRDAPTGTPSVRATIDIGHVQSTAAAGSTIFMMRANAGRDGIAVTDISGIGDVAYGSRDTTGAYSVKAQHGPWIVQTAVAAQNVELSALRAGASELAKRTLAKLP